MNERIIIEVNSSGERLDLYLAKNTEISRARIQGMIQDGSILVNELPCKKNLILCDGDRIQIDKPQEKPLEVVPQDIPLDILYEDDYLCVINKPQGMVVHPAPGNSDGTLVNALLFHLDILSKTDDITRPGIVHRIDKLTSGLLVVAKNESTHEKLSKQFAEHTARRSYLALVHGNLKEDSGTVNANIGRHRIDRKKMAVTQDGRTAITHWQVLERYGTATLLKLELETGRTHQIRVHMAYIKHPVMGDQVYGTADARYGLFGQALHGYRLQFEHPSTNKTCAFYAPIPEFLRSALKRFSSDFSWEKDLYLYE